MKHDHPITSEEASFQSIIPLYGRPEFASTLRQVFSGHLLEQPMAPDTAYQLIKDEILADAKPGLNLATFCNETFTDPYGKRIIADSINKNFIDHTEFPGTNLAERRAIRIIATEMGTVFDEEEFSDATAEAEQGLYGSETIGSSEAIMLGLIAHRFIWEQKHRVLLDNPQWGLKADPYDRPVVLMSAHVHGCWDKYCRYFNAVPLYIEIKEPPYAIHDGNIIKTILNTPLDDPKSPYAKYLRDKMGYKEIQSGRTIGELVMCVGTVIGTTFTGNYDNIPDIDVRVNEYCSEYNTRYAQYQEPFQQAYRDWYASQFKQQQPQRIPELMDIPIHVDAAAAGFVLMFSSNGAGVKFNFRDCPNRVLSLSMSNHKFGMTFTGLGSVVFKNSQIVDRSLVYHIAYLGGSFDDYTVNFSRGSAMVVMQYYNFLSFGRRGYQSIMDNCVSNTEWFLKEIKKDELLNRYLKNISNIPITSNQADVIYLPIIALTFPDAANPPAWNLTDLSDKLAESGWVVPAYHIPVQSPEDTNGIEVLRIVVQQSVSRDKLHRLLLDLRTAINILKQKTEGATRSKHEDKRMIARHTVCPC